MQNAMFFPNRILYREELLSTTVTYAVDLDLNEFLNLKPLVCRSSINTWLREWHKEPTPFLT